MKTPAKKSGDASMSVKNFLLCETLYRNIDNDTSSNNDIKWQILISTLFKSAQNNNINFAAMTIIALKCFVCTNLYAVRYFPNVWSCILFVCVLLITFSIDIFIICNKIRLISKYNNKKILYWSPIVFTIVEIISEWICGTASVIFAAEWTEWLILLGTPLALPNMYKICLKNILQNYIAFYAISWMSKLMVVKLISWIFNDGVQCLNHDGAGDILWASAGSGKHICLKIDKSMTQDTMGNSSFQTIVNSALKQAGCHVSLVSLRKLLRNTEVCGLPTLQWRSVNDVVAPISHLVLGSEPVLLCVAGIGERLHRDLVRLADPLTPLSELEGQMFMLVKPDILVWTNPSGGINEAMKFLQSKFYF